jgi:hypothetical protein
VRYLVGSQVQTTSSAHCPIDLLSTTLIGETNAQYKAHDEKRDMETSTFLIGAQLHRLCGGHSRLPDDELVLLSRSQTNDIGLVRIDSVVTNVIPGRFDSIHALAPFQ